ncbi:hypothetical protein ATN89_18645 [Comamonas thiooxydans]|nr:hypothetical protein ATN89_18645 [Comamonas thiooxydans]
MININCKSCSVIDTANKKHTIIDVKCEHDVASKFLKQIKIFLNIRHHHLVFIYVKKSINEL